MQGLVDSCIFPPLPSPLSLAATWTCRGACWLTRCTLSRAGQRGQRGRSKILDARNSVLEKFLKHAAARSKVFVDLAYSKTEGVLLSSNCTDLLISKRACRIISCAAHTKTHLTFAFKRNSSEVLVHADVSRCTIDT